MKTATCALLELVISVFEVSRRACEEAERQGKCVLALLRSQEIGSAAFAGLFVSATHFLRGLHISGDPQFWRLTTEPATDRKNQGSGGVIPPEPCAFSSCLCRCILCSDLLLHPPNQLSQLRLTFRLGEGVDIASHALSIDSGGVAAQIRPNRAGRCLFPLLPAKSHTADHRGEHGLVFAVSPLSADTPWISPVSPPDVHRNS